jgi:6-pyruvoyl-tetrahydropterin synthase related domain
VLMEPVEPAPLSAAARRRYSGSFTLFLVALASSAVVGPFFFFGNASGHDIQFHLSSWIDVAGQWREGTLYPRWAEWADWGFGEPRFIFYPPVSWLAGAALGSVLPWSAATGAYIWLALVVAGITMWKLVREWLPAPQATTAAVFFAVNPYNLAIVYYRSDFAELLAVTFLPLLLWAALRAIRGEWRRVPHLAVVFAIIWLSNAPEGVIATYSLVLLFLFGCLLRRSARPLLVGATGMAAGFGLAAFYIVPAAWERSWVQISRVLAANLRPEQNFLFAHSSDAEFQLFNWKISSVAVGMIIVTGVACLLSRRRRAELGEMWWMLLGLGTVAAFVMFRPSVLLWRYLPELSFLQFPWRWLGPLGVALAFFAAAAISAMRTRWKARLATALVVAAMGITGALIATSTWWDSDDAPFLAGEIRNGHGYEGVDEYEPVGADRYELPGATPDAEEIPNVPATPAVAILDSTAGKIGAASGVRVDIQQWTGERKVFSAETAEPVRIAVRLVNYAAWQVRVDGARVRPESAEMTAQMLLPLAAGNHHVEIIFYSTPDRTVGGAISFVSAVGLLGAGLISRRRKFFTAVGGA